MRMKVAGAQIPVTLDIDENVKTLERSIDYAFSEKADILLSPEGSLSGYTHNFDIQKTREALDYITTKARKLKLGLALGTCFIESDGKCYNQIRFYKSDGEYLGFHSKILTCGTMEEPPQGENKITMLLCL